MVGNPPDPVILRTPLGRIQKGSKNWTPRGLRFGAGPEIEGGEKREGAVKARGIQLILAMKPLRKCDGGIGEKILNRFRPSKLFLS